MPRGLRPGLIAEGDSDCDFLEPVIDRQLRELLEQGTKTVEVRPVSRSACVKKHGKRRFHDAALRLADPCELVFVHADHHEAHEADAMAREINGRCRAVVLIPKRETEAWILADPSAFRRIRGAAVSHLPPVAKDVEKVQEPKTLLLKVLGPAGIDRPADEFSLLGRDIGLTALAAVPAYAAWVSETEKALKGLKYL
jgi:hypothetical protein